MEIDILSLVKKLRAETQAPLGDCQKALKHTNGNYEEARVHLRKLGLANADKKSSRTTESGFVAAFANGNFGVIIEVNSETDFVARSALFQMLITSILLTAYHNKVDNLIDLMKFKIDSRVINSYIPLVSQIFSTDLSINSDDIAQINGESIDYAIKIIISIVGENIALSRLETLNIKNGSVFSYLHNRQSSIVGSAGIILAIETEVEGSEIKDLAHKLSMHTIASRPDVVHENDIELSILEKEKEIYKEQLLNEGKKGPIVEKILVGKVAKFYEKVVLLKQPYFFDGSTSIEKFLESKKSEFNTQTLVVSDFKMFFLGGSES